MTLRIRISDSGESKFTKKAKQEYLDYKKLYMKLPDPLILYRVIVIKNKTELRKKDLGIYWSLDEDTAENYGNLSVFHKDGDHYLFKAKIKKDDIDWYITLIHNMKWGDEEKEINLKQKSPIEVLDVKVNGKWAKQSFKAVA